MKVIIVGYGSIGKRHVNNVRSRFPEAVLMLVSSHLKQAPEGCQLFGSLEEIMPLAASFAIVANHANLHVATCVPLLSEGIPVLVEKPLCLNPDEAQVLQTFRNNPGMMVGYCLRFHDVFQALDRHINRSGSAIRRIQATCLSHLADWRASDFRTSGSARPEFGGGVLLEVSHEIDYVCALLGRPHSVTCEEIGERTLGLQVEEHVQLHLTFPDGVVAAIELSFASSKVERMATLELNSGETLKADFIQVEITPSVLGNLLPDERGDMYLKELEAIHHLSLGQTGSGATVEEAVIVLEVIEAAKTSMETGETVHI